MKAFNLFTLEIYIGGLEKNKHADKKTTGTQGRSTKTKTAIVGLKQRGGKTIVASFNKVDSNAIQHYLDNSVL